MYSPESETIDSDELDEVIQSRLRYTLSYAAEYSDYWAQKFEEADIIPEEVEGPEDLLRLDPIGHEEVVDRQPPEAGDFEWTIFHEDMSYHAHCTSGTTGVEKWVMVNEDDEKISNEAVRRGFAAAGLDDSTVLANFLPKGPYMSGKQSEDAADGFVQLHHGLGHSNTPQRDRVLSLFQGTIASPTALFGSPSTIEQVSRELREFGVEPADLGVEQILLVGEASDQQRRESIGRLYGASVTNNYATTEFGFVAYQSPECDSNGIHVIEDLCLVLLVDEETRELVSEGEIGEVWITTLYPEGYRGGTPLFNYRPGDIAKELDRRECACGRTHRMISDVVRSDNAVQVHQAARITPTIIENVIHQEQFRGLLNGEYLVEIRSQDDPRDTIIIRVEVLSENQLEEDRKFIADTHSGNVDREKLATSIRSEFLSNHVAFDAFHNAEYLNVDVDILEPDTLSFGPGKPERIRIEDD